MGDRKAYFKAYYLRNRQKLIDRAMEWQELNGHPKQGADLRIALKRRRDENRAFFLEKLGGRCVDCGYHAHPSALQFDHLIPRDKKRKVASLMTIKNRDDIWLEVKKCVLRCANCHVVKTVTNGESGRRPSRLPKSE